MFTDTSHLNSGDIAIILRNDGTVQLASNIDPESMGSIHAYRHVQHMLMAVGAFAMLTEQHEELAELGASEEWQERVRNSMNQRMN